MQHMMKFASPDPRLAQPHFSYLLQHHGVLARSHRLTLPILVVRLPAPAQMAASPRHTQSRDEFLREDVPKGFFTTRTP